MRFHPKRRPTCRLVRREKYLGRILKRTCTLLFYCKKTIGHNIYSGWWNDAFSVLKVGVVYLFDVTCLYDVICRTLNSFCWNATFSDLSVTEMCWMAGTFQWQFSQLSLPIQSPFNHQSVILLLRNKNLNYLSLNFAEKNSQTVFKQTVILIFAVVTLLVIVCWGDYKIQNASRVNCPAKLSVNCRAKIYVNCKYMQ